MNKRKHQGGWIANFIIVGVILIALALVVIYFVKTHQNMFDSKNQPTDISKQDNKSSSGQKTDQKDSGQPQQKSNNTQSRTNNDQASNSSGASKNDDSDLPHTGPSDSVWSVIAIAMLTFVTVSYFRSRSA